jgi:hypothetical protein
MDYISTLYNKKNIFDNFKCHWTVLKNLLFGSGYIEFINIKWHDCMVICDGQIKNNIILCSGRKLHINALYGIFYHDEKRILCHKKSHINCVVLWNNSQLHCISCHQSFVFSILCDCISAVYMVLLNYFTM